MPANGPAFCPPRRPLGVWVLRTAYDVLAVLDGESANVYSPTVRRRLRRSSCIGRYYCRPSTPFVPHERGRSGMVPTALTNKRERLLEAEVAQKFLAELVVRPLLSDEYVSVDGTHNVDLAFDGELPGKGRVR